MKLLIPAILLVSSIGFAQVPTPTPPEPACIRDIQPCDGTCLSESDSAQVAAALKELKGIKESPAKIEVTDEIVIIRDWDNRVYINGGTAKPIKLKLKLGPTIERDMEATLPIQVNYREKPPDPMFRLRIRAQAGMLVPEMIKSFSGGVKDFWDASVGLDFFHIGPVNLAVSPGIRSIGIGPGFDITKNFGVTAGYAFIYRGFDSSAFTSIYFSFN